MKTKAVRIHGKMDLRLEEIELPQVGPDDVQVKVISDSICMSTYKAAVEGEDHKRVPNDVAEHPTIVGHEFCGVITEVGENWKNKYKPGQGFAIQPAHFYKGSQLAPGYSYQYCGGDSQYSNIPIETLLTDNLLPYNSDTYFYGSLAEPMSCIIGTFHAMYHTKPGSYEHQMGIVEGGKMAMLASVGPMGLGAIDYALHCDRRPSLLVITDIDDARLERAQSIYTVEHAKEMGVELHYVNTAKPGCDTNYLRELSGGTGYDDVICFAPVRPVVEQAGDILGFDGCLNFFAGPTNSQFKAEFNWYNVHYLYTHVVGTSGGNTSDMKEAIEMMTSGKINPAAADFEDVKWSPVRKATAKSMTKSLSTMAQLTQQYSFDATQIQAYRAMLKPLDAPMGKVSLNDMVMFAVAKTIKSCPDLNANVLEENVVRHFNTVNLGFACDTPRGLIVPTIFNADQMTLLELSMEAKRLAAEAREGKLSPDYMSGATFTISNIGSFGCEAFTPVINPPQTGILGVCNIQTKIKSAKDGVIETYPAMGLSLTFDHRVIDGAPAARYMSELCKSLENFMTLLAK